MGAADFASKDVGTGVTVTATGLSLSGADAGDYVLSSTTATSSADITPATVTPCITASDKVYDSTTTATLSSQGVSGVYSGDDVSLVVGAATSPARTWAPASPSPPPGLSLTGADADDYVLSSDSATSSADITPATVTPIVANDKVYDSTTTATLSSQGVDGVLGDDDVSLVVTAADFASKDAGTGPSPPPA